EEGLDDRGRADVLHPDGVLGPADGVDERPGALRPGALAERLGDAEEEVAGDPAGLLHELGRVAPVVPAQQLEDTARMLEAPVLGRLRTLELDASRAGPLSGGVAVVLTLTGRRGHLHPLVRPGPGRVRALLRVEAAEDAVEVLGVAEVLADDGRGVGVIDDVRAAVS